MGLPTNRRRADLRGAARLAADATLGVTDVVEAMHRRIARLPGRGSADTARTEGITGLVYRSIRGITRAVGAGVDAAFSLLPAAADAAGEPGRQREALVAALNGVFGDHLAATGNPLATPMALRRDGRALVIERAALAAALPGASDRALLLVHGLCMNDLQWSREQGDEHGRDRHDHGAALARDLGFAPLYLHYNSGLHISHNGRALAELLERLLAEWPGRLRQLVLLGHSMGGLVARSAIAQAEAAGMQWTARLGALVCLGTPHHGAALERAGHGLDTVLSATPYAAPLARLGKARSAGITDLRHGWVMDAQWAGRDRFAPLSKARQVASPPLPARVRCFAAAAALGAAGGVPQRLLGDGLVSVDSALGRHRDPRRTLGFAADHQWLGHGIDHLQLLDHGELYPQLVRWLAEPA